MEANFFQVKFLLNKSLQSIPKDRLMPCSIWGLGLGHPHKASKEVRTTSCIVLRGYSGPPILQSLCFLKAQCLLAIVCTCLVFPTLRLPAGSPQN